MQKNFDDDIQWLWSKPGVKGANREPRGVNRGKGERTGGEGEQRERTGSEGGGGGKGSEQWSEGSEYISILGFSVPTTCSGKKFGDQLQWMSVPTTWK